MKCYYEVLGVARTVDNDELKKVYRKLVLQWHPDKNLDNPTEAKEQFQLVQQAYEVLSDPNERSWYDRHRDAILKGGIGEHYEDKSLNVYQYFTSSCYVGYGDDEKGFYAVYREVFKTIAAEDSEFNDCSDSEFEIPEFGKSDSDYDDVVHVFYSYWQSYSTKKSYAWLDIYNIREAGNRRVLKLVEKENKKVRDKAKKERNEEVRALVAFVRKRDKRVQAYSKFLQEKANENLKKAEQNRLLKKKQRKQELDSCVEAEWSKFSNVEKELKEIEAKLAAEFNDDLSESLSSGESDYENEMMSNSLYCIACNKLFKTEKAFENHENSRKHKENLERLKEEMKEDSSSDELIEDENENSISDEISEPEGIYNKVECHDNDMRPSEEVSNGLKFLEKSEDKELSKSSKKSKKKIKKQTFIDISSDDDPFDPLSCQSKKQKKKQLQQNILKTNIEHKNESINIEDGLLDEAIEVKSKKTKGKKKQKLVQESDNLAINSEESSTSTNKIYKNKKSGSNKRTTVAAHQTDIKDLNITCAMCNSFFTSRQKLFDHLKQTGHAVPLTKNVQTSNKKDHKIKNFK